MTQRLHTEEFHKAVAGLSVPGMGTEVVGPLLANLIQLLRPERVLEVGMGYTTPYLAAALADTEDAVRQESVALAAKTREHLARGAELDDSWLLADPPLVSPSHHLEPYRPRLVAVDNLSIADSSAGRVQEVLRELDLDGWVTVVNADLKDAAERLPDDFPPIDLAWVDAWECLYFFDHFWDLINPDGGLVVMHYLMTYPEGEALLRYIAKFQQAHPGELEVVNLLESQKLMQNSITVLRRTSGVRARRYAGPGGAVRYTEELRQDAERHLGLVARPGSDSGAGTGAAVPAHD
ncbi:class I SAM-dependent methyltransferase [Streptomyces sp. NPDC088812]|uniref:class I SAM-dependent methyltransferase n=1 Tax=Streptomyces sp. NPDC088812 TaxID=3365905 RepID=UPI003828DED5